MSSGFSGNWLVNYDPKDFGYPEILAALAKISDYLDDERIIFNSINIKVNKNGSKNHFIKDNGDIFLSFCAPDAEFAEIVSRSWEAAVFSPLTKPIRTVSLLFPRQESDPRWKTMGLPAGQLFLASSLNAGGFTAMPETLALPGGNPPPEAVSADMTGFSLFEDLLPLLRPFLASFKASCRGILAAGGPFPTLAPLAAAYQLPQVNLWVRGEAELVLPRLLQALNEGDAGKFMGLEGVFWQRPGVIAMAGFDRVNRPQDLGELAIDLDFLEPRHLSQGLEMNFSRGCRRGCVFCCRAQGGKFRKLPLAKAEELLKAYKNNVIGRGDPLDRPVLVSEMPGRPAGSPLPLVMNINDDDILQDPGYARSIFVILKADGFRIFGVQTSTASLVGNDGLPATEVLDLVSDPGIYIDSRPLIWLGTDAFLPGRARRLGKKLPPPGKFRELLRRLEERKIRHFHYWISSDGGSTWGEFLKELALIFGLFRDFPGFGLLAHAPFVVPYPSSRLFAALGPGDSRLKARLALDAPDPRFSYRVIDRLETSWPQLNNLLKNEKAGGEKGFFDFLKEKEFMAATQLAYHFLKQEMLQNDTANTDLLGARNIIERLIEELMEHRIR